MRAMLMFDSCPSSSSFDSAWSTLGWWPACHHRTLPGRPSGLEAPTSTRISATCSHIDSGLLYSSASGLWPRFSFLYNLSRLRGILFDYGGGMGNAFHVHAGFRGQTGRYMNCVCVWRRLLLSRFGVPFKAARPALQRKSLSNCDP